MIKGALKLFHPYWLNYILNFNVKYTFVWICEVSKTSIPLIGVIKKWDRVIKWILCYDMTLLLGSTFLHETRFSSFSHQLALCLLLPDITRIDLIESQKYNKIQSQYKMEVTKWISKSHSLLGSGNPYYISMFCWTQAPSAWLHLACPACVIV
jgi:hypothetical protein